MKRISSLLLSALMISSALMTVSGAGQSAQTADDIIAKYIKRSAAWSESRLSIRCAVREGSTAAAASRRRQPGEQAAEQGPRGVFPPGHDGVTAYDGKTGWKIEPWQGKKDAEPLGEEEMKAIVEDAEFDGSARQLPAEGQQGRARSAPTRSKARDVYKLKVTLAANGDVRTYYIDTDDYVPIKIEMKRTVRGAEREFEIELGDYKEVERRGTCPSPSRWAPRAARARQGEIRLGAHRGEPGHPGQPLRNADSRGHGRDRSTHGRRKRRQAAPPAMPKSPPLSVDLRSYDGLAPKVDSETISGLGARNIGSAAMSGRIAAVDAVHEGDAAHGLRRRRERRRLEVGQRRHDLQAGVRQAAGAVDRRGHDRSEESEGRLGRHRRGVDAQQRLDRRRRLQVDRRRRELDEHGPHGTPSTSRRSSSTRPSTNTVYVCVPGQALERQRRARRLQDDRRRQDLDEDPRRAPTPRPAAR